MFIDAKALENNEIKKSIFRKHKNKVKLSLGDNSRQTSTIIVRDNTNESRFCIVFLFFLIKNASSEKAAHSANSYTMIWSMHKNDKSFFETYKKDQTENTKQAERKIAGEHFWRKLLPAETPN